MGRPIERDPGANARCVMPPAAGARAALSGSDATRRAGAACPLTMSPKSSTSAASSVGRLPWVFTRRRNSSRSRSMTFVVLSAAIVTAVRRPGITTSLTPRGRNQSVAPGGTRPAHRNPAGRDYSTREPTSSGTLAGVRSPSTEDPEGHGLPSGSAPPAPYARTYAARHFSAPVSPVDSLPGTATRWPRHAPC
jgi:hypothetical protein